MVNRLVSVGDDFSLPATVKAGDANLPARLQEKALRPLSNSVNPAAPSTYALASRQFRGYDTVDHIGWLVSSADLVTTADHGVTVSAARGFPTNVIGANVIKVLRAGGYVWMGARDSTDSLTKLWRAPVTTGTYTWSGPLATMSALGGLLMSSMGADDQYVYLGDYADPTGGAKVYRVSVATGTPEAVTPTGIIRHVHAIAADPYNPGHVWMTTGDSGPRIYRSTNYGATWTLINSTWQAVQISFSADWVHFAADSAVVTAFVMNRTDLVPLAATPSFHYEIAVPGGAASRLLTDLQTTSGSKTVTSATANFTAADVGKKINHTASDPGNYITAVASATSATTFANSWATGTKTGFIDGDRFYDKAFWGAVDPATGVYYCIANDNSGKGTRSGLFMIRKVGEPLELVETFLSQITGEMFIADGYLHSHVVARPLLALA